MQQPKNQNSNPNDDGSWECFRGFVHVHMWDGFAYLFLLVCDSEKNFNFLTTDFNEIKESIFSLYQGGGTSNEKYLTTNGIIDQYRKCRMKKDEEMRNELMLSIFERLELHDIYEPNLSNLVRIFGTMSILQRRSLRNIFMSRIYGYSRFTEYLSKEWNRNNRYQTKANVDEVLNKDAKEQKINQNENEKLYADVLKSEKSSESKEAIGNFPTNEGSKKDLDIDKLKNKAKVTTTESSTLENEKDNEVEIKKSTSQVSKSKEKEEKTKEEEVKENGNKKSSKNKRQTRYPKSKHGKREENIESKSGAHDSSEKETTRKGSLRNSKNEHSNNDSINLKQSSQENDVERLQQEIERLRQEAARHQAALGGITNVGWSDNDSNNSMQLTKDIENLQKDLEDFTRVKRKDVEIKIEAASELFENYKCKTPLENKNMKLVLGAALQQHLISFILKYAKDYFEHNDISEVQENNTENKLEAAVQSKTKELIKLTTRFQETRTGTDEHSRILPIKLRQQIYAALGHRGFSDLNHPLITQLTKDLKDEVNKYRIITSEDKNRKLEKEIITIIIQVLRIFYFRLNTQEPIPSMEFYKSGEYFDPGVMESIGQIEKDEELEVEICSFPVIALNKNLDEEVRRVFTKAQVIVRTKGT